MTFRLPTLSPVHRRLRPLICASFFGGVALWVPIEKLFLAEIGFTPQSIGVMAAVYAAVVPVLEIPSGILADRWSRRGVLVIGNIGMVVSVVVGGLSTNVTTYVLAAVLLGVYFAMQSGTLDAVVYDTVLEETGSSDTFESTMGRLRMVESSALVLGAITGGALAALTAPRVTYFSTLPFLAVSTLSLLSFREPRLHQVTESRSLRQHLSVTVDTIRGDRRLLGIAALLILTGLLTQAVFEFGPLWLVDSGTGAGTFGPAWAGLMASLGLGGALAGRVRFESALTLAAMTVLLAAASVTLLVGHNPAVVTTAQVVLAMLSVAIGIFLTRLLHDAIPSDVRSGVASGVGAMTWVTFLPFALAFGAVSERWGVHAAGWMVVVVALAVAALLMIVVGTSRTVITVATPQPTLDVTYEGAAA